MSLSLKPSLNQSNFSATGPDGAIKMVAIAASSVPTPPAGEEYYFLDLDNLDNQGQGTPSTKNSSGTVRVRDDFELIDGVLRPSGGGDLETGTAVTTYTATGDDVTGDYTNAGANVEYSSGSFKLIDSSGVPVTIYNGTTDYASSSDAVLKITDAQTWCFEVYIPTGAATNRGILSNYYDGHGLQLAYETSGKISLFMTGAYAYSTVLAKDTWHKIVATMTSGGASIYNNATLSETQSTAGPNTSTSNFVIACKVGPTLNFQGRLRNIEIYSGTASNPTAWVPGNTGSLSDVSLVMQSEDGSGIDNGQSITFSQGGSPSSTGGLNDAVDTEILNAASTNYAPGSLDCLDELSSSITTGNLNVDYNINDAGFTGSLIDIDAFKALPASTFASATNLALRLQLIGAQELTDTSIQGPSSKSVLDTLGDIYTEVNGVEIHRLSSKQTVGDVVTIAETTTPTPVADSGKIYPKADNELYFQDGAGTEHAIAKKLSTVTTVDAATYDLLVTDDILHVTYTATAAVTSLTIPTAQTTAGRVIMVKDAGDNATTNNITIDTEGTEKIEFTTDPYVISTDGDSVTLYCDGTDWFVI